MPPFLAELEAAAEWAYGYTGSAQANSDEPNTQPSEPQTMAARTKQDEADQRVAVAWCPIGHLCKRERLRRTRHTWVPVRSGGLGAHVSRVAQQCQVESVREAQSLAGKSEWSVELLRHAQTNGYNVFEQKVTLLTTHPCNIRKKTTKLCA